MHEPLYIDIHNHGLPQPGSITSMTPDEYLRYRPEKIVIRQNARPASFSCVGLHPWHLESHGHEAEFSLIESAARKGELIAIGECGIDRRKGAISPDEQRKIFERHVEIAEAFDLPVVIHCVRSLSDITSVRKSHKKTPWMIHGFMGNSEQIRECRRHGILLSPGIALMIWQKIDDHPMLALLKELDPLEFFLETDGVEVEIRYIYEIAARHTGRPAEELAEILENNFRRIFQRDPRTGESVR